MARSSECREQYAQKVIDTAGIVRDACFRQQSRDLAVIGLYFYARNANLTGALQD